MPNRVPAADNSVASDAAGRTLAPLRGPHRPSPTLTGVGSRGGVEFTHSPAAVSTPLGSWPPAAKRRLGVRRWPFERWPRSSPSRCVAVTPNPSDHGVRGRWPPELWPRWSTSAFAAPTRKPSDHRVGSRRGALERSPRGSLGRTGIKVRGPVKFRAATAVPAVRPRIPEPVAIEGERPQRPATEPQRTPPWTRR